MRTINKDGWLVVSVVLMLSGGCTSDHGATDPNPYYPWPALSTSMDDALRRKDTVEYLKITNDTSTVLPVEILQLYKLRHISWHYGRLKEMPGILVNMPQIIEISLSHNKINTVSPSIGSMTGLWTLDLISNSIVQLPDDICNLRYLENLYLDTNRIAYMPQNIGKLTSLRWLSIRDNPINANEIDRIKNVLPNCRIFHD